MSLPSNLPGLNFQLGEDIDALRDAVRDFAQSEIALMATQIPPPMATSNSPT